MEFGAFTFCPICVSVCMSVEKTLTITFEALEIETSNLACMFN